jgi:hypothetical protein
MTVEFESRRQRRAAEAEQANVNIPAGALPDSAALENLDALLLLAQQMAQPAAQPQIAEPKVAPILSRREMRLQEASRLAVDDLSSRESGDSGSEPMFQTSSGFSIDTVTNSIVLPVTPDALSAPMISESGVTLKTGSIELPNLNAGTGSITIPTAAQIADDALSSEASSSFVSDISPIAAKSLLLQNPSLDLETVKTKGSQGQLFYALTATMLMLTVGGFLVVAWMYGVI